MAKRKKKENLEEKIKKIGEIAKEVSKHPAIIWLIGEIALQELAPRSWKEEKVIPKEFGEINLGWLGKIDLFPMDLSYSQLIRIGWFALNFAKAIKFIPLIKP